MKRFFLYIMLFITASLSCAQEKQYGKVPQNITIAGRIGNYSSDSQIDVFVNRLGLEQENIQVQVDSLGNFIATLESYIPLDAVIDYRANFWVLLHPGDSLFVYFDGKCKNRPELLETIKFSGDRAETNQYVAKYQQMYFSSNIYSDWDKKTKP